MVDLEIREGWVLVQAPKCLLVLSREKFIAALKRGKPWRRSQAMAARLGAQETGGIRDAGRSRTTGERKA